MQHRGRGRAGGLGAGEGRWPHQAPMTAQVEEGCEVDSLACSGEEPQLQAERQGEWRREGRGALE